VEQSLTNLVFIADLHFGSSPPQSWLHGRELWNEQLMARTSTATTVAERLRGYLVIVGDVFDREAVTWDYLQMFADSISVIDPSRVVIIPGPGHDTKRVPFNEGPIAYTAKTLGTSFIMLEDSSVELGGVTLYTPKPRTRGDFTEWLQSGALQNLAYDVILLHGPITTGANFLHVNPKDLLASSQTKLVACGDIHPPFYYDDGSTKWFSPGSIVAKQVPEAQFEASCVIARIDNGNTKTTFVELSKNRKEDFIEIQPTESHPIGDFSLVQALLEDKNGAIRIDEEAVIKMAKSAGMSNEQLEYLRERFD